MERLFGVPVGSLALVLAAMLAIAVGVVSVLAFRNRIFFKLGVRNLTRRRGRSAVIVLGLMLATAIIASALATGDTMATTIRSSVYRTLGATDETVAVKSATTGGSQYAQRTQSTYFPVSTFDQVAASTNTMSMIDGVAPAIIESVAVQDQTSAQNEPRSPCSEPISRPRRLRNDRDDQRATRRARRPRVRRGVRQRSRRRQVRRAAR